MAKEEMHLERCTLKWSTRNGALKIRRHLVPKASHVNAQRRAVDLYRE